MSPEFLLTSLIVVLAPGTGVIYTLAMGISRGFLGSLSAAFGCTLGILPHLAASILGLAALLHTSAILFQGVKYAGAAYLLYLAWGALKEKGALSINNKQDINKGPISIAVSGFLINILNPKLSIFFLAFLPQFVPNTSTNHTLDMSILGGIFMAMTFVIFVLYGTFAAQLRHRIFASAKAMKWFSRSIAGTFAALGLKLALTDR
ncbi:MAG: LysE family translocator [Sneathiella sp.]